MPTQAEPTNLLSLKPKRSLEWETHQDEKVVLLVPKFKNRLLVKWFVPMLKKPNIRVKLDERGSFVWQRCDGATTVEAIAEQMAKQFDEPLDTTYERIGKFLQHFARDKFMTLDTHRSESS